MMMGAKPTDSLQRYLLACVSGLSLSAAQLDTSFSLLAWIGFVPLLLAIHGTSYWQTYRLAFTTGFCLFATSKYWIFSFVIIAKGLSQPLSFAVALVYWVYCAHLLVLAALLLNWLVRMQNRASLFAFPLSFLVIELAYPMLFPWHIGNSQHDFLVALQAISLTGVWGLDFVIALTNTLLYRLLVLRLKTTPISGVLRQHAIAATLLLCWFGYGIVSLYSWNNALEHWQKLSVGLIQPNEAPDVGGRNIPKGFGASYLPQMAMSERLSHLDPDLIVWSESQYKGVFDNQRLADAYRSTITQMATPVLLQDFDNVLSATGKTQRYNVAGLISPAENTIEKYAKQKLIPFGETAELTEYWPWLNEKIAHFSGDFLTQIQAGQSHHHFALDEVDVIPLICYETISSSFVASAVQHRHAVTEKDRGVILAAMSNDGWFGHTHQPFQHILPSSLRAVENRMSMVHSVNNGPSIAVLPTGEKVLQSRFNQPGGYLVDVPYNPSAKPSFYSRFPFLFPIVVVVGLLLSVLVNQVGIIGRR